MTISSSNTWVFIVGNCAEWETRDVSGDKQLYKCFCRIIPSEQITYIKDEDCTKVFCEDSLLRVLKKTRSCDTFFFYYGGHGSKDGFCTHKEHWKYSKVLDMIEYNFQGDKIWLLIDCCYSGNFLNLFEPSSLSPSYCRSELRTYLCISSTKANEKAWDYSDDQWAMTGPFCDAMKHHPNLDQDNNFLSIQDVIGTMAYHHAIIDGNSMQCTLIGKIKRIDPKEMFPFLIFLPKLRNETLIPSNLLRENEIDNNHGGTIREPVDNDKWKRLVGIQKGDAVLAKWQGGYPRPDFQKYLFPLYFPATIKSSVITNNNSWIEVEYEWQKLRWVGKIYDLAKNILPADYFETETDELIESHRILARHNRFFDASLMSGTEVWAIYKDNVYQAKVMNNSNYCDEVSQKMMKVRRYLGVKGPYIWVQWKNENGNHTLIPRYHCCVVEHNHNKSADDISGGSKKSDSSVNNKNGSANEIEKNIINNPTSTPNEKLTVNQILNFNREELCVNQLLTPQEAILKGMQSMNRDIIFEGKQGYTASCLHDGEWYKCVISSNVPSMEIISKHVCFSVSGKYYCVQRYDEDGEACSLLPENLVRNIKKKASIEIAIKRLFSWF